MIIAGMSAFIGADDVAASVRHQPKPIFREDLKVADEAILRTIGYYSAVIALVHCHKRGRTFTPPKPDGSIIGNLLLMMGIIDARSGVPVPDPKIEACLSKLWILYADHEMTNSTAASLHAASTLTDPASCVIAGLISGYGP
jgi:citrate synthase